MNFFEHIIHLSWNTDKCKPEEEEGVLLASAIFSTFQENEILFSQMDLLGLVYEEEIWKHVAFVFILENEIHEGEFVNTN